jgi:hypothetical protein
MNEHTISIPGISITTNPDKIIELFCTPENLTRAGYKEYINRLEEPMVREFFIKSLLKDGSVYRYKNENWFVRGKDNVWRIWPMESKYANTDTRVIANSPIEAVKKISLAYEQNPNGRIYDI